MARIEPSEYFGDDNWKRFEALQLLADTGPADLMKQAVALLQAAHMRAAAPPKKDPKKAPEPAEKPAELAVSSNGVGH